MLPFDICRWLVEEEDEEVVHKGTVQAPPVFDQPPAFDQQAFAEAVGIATAATAQASIASSQGGPSNLQRFRAHHPQTFTRGGDPRVADHWFM